MSRFARATATTTDMTTRALTLLLCSLLSASLAACGSEDPVLTDMDSGMPDPDGGPGEDPDSGPGEEPDAGPGEDPDAGPLPPACSDDWTPPADPTAGAWDPRFNMPGVGGTAPADGLALAMGPGDELYVGGMFSHAGSTPAANVVRWTASSGWQTLGDGLDGEVIALAVHPSGMPIYAASRSSETWETGVYSFDGTSWTNLTTVGGIGNIHDLDVGPDGSLYVSGLYEGIGGNAAIQNFAVWDGTTWASLGGNPDSEVYTALVSSAEVCIGGHFANVGATVAQNVACWNGTAWIPRDMPIPFYQVRVLARDAAGALLAGGHFSLDDTDSSVGGSLARWSGSSWELVGGGVHVFPGAPGYVEGIVSLGSDIYVTGYFVMAGTTDTGLPVNSVARWDGTSWHDVGGGAYREMGIGLIEQNVRDMVADSMGNVFIAGMFTSVGTKNASHVAFWDGSYWQALVAPGQLSAGVNGTVATFASRGDCGVYVGGSFRLAGDIVANNVALFDDTGWHDLGGGLTGVVTALAVDEDGGVYAGGDFTGASFYNLGYWDGTTWSGVGNASGTITALVLADDGTLYAAGEFDVIGSTSAARIARWDGSAWHALGDGLAGTPYAMIIDTDGSLVVAGQLTAAGGADVANIARWDGTSWSSIGAGLAGDGPIRALAIYEGQLVASGQFATLPDGGNGVAVFDGTEWTSLGGGLYSQWDWSLPYVNGLAVLGDTLFAVGDFSLAGGAEPVRVAYYDGTTWQPLGLGIGLTDIAETAHAAKNGVWIGGAFTKADETPSVAIAHWQNP